MSPVAWALWALAAWILVALGVGLAVGPVLRRNRKRHPKPPHVEPKPRPHRDKPQDWPPSNGHGPRDGDR